MIDFTSYYNKAPYIMFKSTPLSKIFTLFRTMGLRHIVIINSSNKVEGIITRQNIKYYEDKIKLFIEKEMKLDNEL